MNQCNHRDVHCLNEYELIRKYRCLDCNAVMMCACDEMIGSTHLPYQLDHGSELDTRQEVPVTAGFTSGICRECRGLPPEAHPVAEIHGRTSKIKRYYWRELAFREMEIFGTWAEARNLDPLKAADNEAREARRQAATEALREIKQLHTTNPKYQFRDESQSQIIQECEVDVINLSAVYGQPTTGRKARLLDSGQAVSGEEYAARHFERAGYNVLRLESRPFHVLFGVYMWLVIQDPSDPHVRIVGFGDRDSADAGEPGKEIWTHLPDDFGTPGYGVRRSGEIDAHLAPEMSQRDELKWLFDYWLGPSEHLRQYLWAHRDEDVQVARKLLDILPAEVIFDILRYLVGDYWRRYCGWPDLLVYNDAEYIFAEVKTSRDKLTEDQKHWIRDNHKELHLPFKLVKLHKQSPTRS